ncbi:unnamed protein product [Lactuca saligna]|uniref:phosphoenolpyruvate carboxylase n=1 Tax=Lactuca saligna TaxID=75948 RepID=A0AA35Z1I7_LACSI|nr:unnamed protein product [Lactuca saligna]
MSYFHETIQKGVPKFLRRVDTALKNIGINERDPYNAPLIELSSWMGGDRHGNPRVTPEVTRDVCLLARMMATNMYFFQIEDLMFKMSIWRCNDELRVRAEELYKSARRDAKHYIEFCKQVPPTEPYRVILDDVRDILYKTRERCRHLLAHGKSEIPEEAVYNNVEHFLQPLPIPMHMWRPRNRRREAPRLPPPGVNIRSLLSQTRYPPRICSPYRCPRRDHPTSRNCVATIINKSLISTTTVFV